jgi:hypothetical protein
MSRMLDMMKQSAVPANLMRSASHGALALPAPEMVEILVYLAQDSIFSQQASMTLAAWDEQSALEIAQDPNTPKEVLEYFIDPTNLRPSLFKSLLENPSVPETRLQQLAVTVTRERASEMLQSNRVLNSEGILHALQRNPHLTNAEHLAIVKALHGGSEEEILEMPELDEFLKKYATEIEAEQNKSFELVKAEGEEADELAELLDTAKSTEESKAADIAWTQKHARTEDQKKISTLQKIARMTVGERVQLGMKGNKDERFILIRDGSKVVSLAVLESPKLTDSEAEMFASMKNVQEVVLRTMVKKRKFMKNYAIIRALANNPRTPLDVGLPLLPHLIAMDLKHLSMNKNVSDTLRKIATKMFKDKTQSRRSE